MTSPSNSDVQNLLPVQAYFNLDGSFNTFIGQGEPFYATANPSQSGLNITNSTINSTTIGATTPSTGVFTNIATTTGTITTAASGPTDIVNKQYVDYFAAGLSWKQPALTATSADITLSGLQTINGVTVVAGDVVLVKNQTNAAENGIYVASAGAWTYSVGGDTWSEYVGAIIFVTNGSLNGTAWFCTAQPGGTLGVTAMNWSNFSVASSYTAGTGLTLTGTVFSITNTGVPASTYGSATATPVFAVNAQGQITSVTNTTITPAIGSVTGLGTNVATWLATPTSSNLAAAVSDETGSGALVFATSPTLITPALGAPASGDFSSGTFTWPTFNQNTTGTAAGLSTTLAIASGGTGQTTASAAFNALSPITTAGDLILGNGANSATRLAIGANATVLTSNGTTASWAALPAGMVYPGAGIAVSTGSAWDTSYTTTGSGTVVALATSPSLTTPILGTPQSGNFSTGTFTWPTFNQNTTGTASNVTGTVAVANGGTGVTTLTGLVYGNGTSAFTAATAAQVVSVIGTTAVTNATNATNATNTAITDDTTTNATMYPTWVTSTSGNLPQKTSSTKLSFNPSTGALSANGTVLTGNTGTVTSVTVAAGTGMSGGGTVTTSGTVTLTNAGVTSVTAGTGISVSASTGGVTITNSSPANSAQLAKAYGFINSQSGSSVLSNSYGVSSVTLTGTGQNTINFSSAFANAQYVIVATTNKGDSNNDMNAIVQTGVTGGSRQQSTTQAFLSNGYGSNFQNSQQVCFVVFSN
jgi:hypothetical protein